MRVATRGDRPALVDLRESLWPGARADHERALDDFFAGRPAFIDQLLISEDAAATLTGFIELRVRNYAEGSEEMAVPYVEGWYVIQDQRGRGVGAALIAGAEAWARAGGYRELASDAELDNQASIDAHRALGFVEVERSVSFLKALD